VELTVVIAILAILLTLITSISGYVMRQGRERETADIQAIVLQAVEAYRDNHPNRDIPYDREKASDPAPLPGDRPFTSANALVNFLTGFWARPDSAIPPHAAVKAAKDILFELPKDAWDGTNGLLPAGRGILDAWKTPMLYAPDEGLGGTPVLISAGPDREFSPPASDDADNIRSDDAK
jgi:type II secretory pathway pseudopilin PulG